MSPRTVSDPESLSMPYVLDGLELRVGSASAGAPGKINEDFYAVVTPSNPEEIRRGMIVALADGISGSGLARIAAETSVRSLVHDYYATSTQWSVGQTLDLLMRSANDWQWAQNARRRDSDAVVTAISAMVLRERHFYVVHVGDIRVYRLRRGTLQLLTEDHTWQRRDMRHVVRRAIGLDSHLVADFSDGELAPRDTFLMVSDGVWEVLGDARMSELLLQIENPQVVADALVRAAHEHQSAYRGRNDATAVAIRIDAPG